MAFKPKSAAETKAKDLGLALARIAEGDGTPANIGVDQLRRVSPRLTPLAVGQMVRKERGIVEATLAERGLGRVVEGARLESVYTGNRIAGSNPAPSANRCRNPL